MSSERPRMPVAVAGGDEAADTDDRPIDRRIYRNNSSRLRRNLSTGFALIIVIAAADTAAWVGLFSDDRLAVVYAGKIPRGEWRTLIEIWNTDIARKVASRCALVLKAPR